MAEKIKDSVTKPVVFNKKLNLGDQVHSYGGEHYGPGMVHLDNEEIYEALSSSHNRVQVAIRKEIVLNSTIPAPVTEPVDERFTKGDADDDIKSEAGKSGNGEGVVKSDEDTTDNE